MSTTNPPEDTAAADNPDDPASLTPPAALQHRRTPHSTSLVGANLVMVLTMASVVGLLLGVVVLVELLT